MPKATASQRLSHIRTFRPELCSGPCPGGFHFNPRKGQSEGCHPTRWGKGWFECLPAPSPLCSPSFLHMDPTCPHLPLLLPTAANMNLDRIGEQAEAMFGIG